jgi:hypothetical protein
VKILQNFVTFSEYMNFNLSLFFFEIVKGSFLQFSYYYTE